MSVIRKLILEDVRCFAGRQEFSIRPLTFLVGENSTGKSTALGCLQVLGDFMRAGDINFNIAPYQMGAFTDIVRKKTGGTDGFRLGFELKIDETLAVIYELLLTERESGSEPIIRQAKILLADGEIVLEPIEPDEINAETMHRIRAPRVSVEGKRKFIVRLGGYHLHRLFAHFPDFRYLSLLMTRRGKQTNGMGKLHQFMKESGLFPLRIHPFVPRVTSFSPIRSKPKRTYDLLEDKETSDGDEMPTVLMKAFTSQKPGGKQLKKELSDFGKASGLFTDIDIKKHGKSTSDPFQLQIKIKGPKVNMMDVGYGISQILPILVRVMNAQRNQTFLLQQPEVHLHPKAQAELSSLLCGLVDSGRSFVVETHSDYMISRAQIEIMREKIKPEDVSLVYLESAKNQVKAHNITFDDGGNMQGAPKGYGEFFLKEKHQLLGLGD